MVQHGALWEPSETGGASPPHEGASRLDRRSSNRLMDGVLVSADGILRDQNSLVAYSQSSGSRSASSPFRCFSTARSALPRRSGAPVKTVATDAPAGRINAPLTCLRLVAHRARQPSR